MSKQPKNWVFLGDSLTEGIGSRRVSYVTELTGLLRKAEQQKPESERRTINDFRLRQENPDTFNQFARFNIAGYWNRDNNQGDRQSLWLWNLAAEARTIETDREWLPLIENLCPQLVIIYRGSLESIIRPAMARGGNWSWWVPRAWRPYAALDPRCYFSTTWWRRGKQVAIHQLKQMIRHHLLRQLPGKPLMDANSLITHYHHLLHPLRGMSAHILILGLIPPNGSLFPGSLENFKRVNERLREFAAKERVLFFDWASLFLASNQAGELWYRDGFHPNAAGAKVLANALLIELGSLGLTSGNTK